mgnify:CR=1 FL=1|tara:strand:- start:440 stop:670 length:231 start_codon:yes stop_codon:yes gene_type:complete
MTIANEIKAAHIDLDMENGNESVKDYDKLVQECESKASDIDQDFDVNETTAYTFIDGSVLVWNGFFKALSAYGSKS